MFGRNYRNNQFPLMFSCNPLSENHWQLRSRLVKLEVVHNYLESSCGTFHRIAISVSLYELAQPFYRSWSGEENSLCWMILIKKKHSPCTTKKWTKAFKFALCGPLQEKMPHDKTTDANSLDVLELQIQTGIGSFDPCPLGDYLENPSSSCQGKNGKEGLDPSFLS